MAATVRPYAERDLEACRGLWEELTERHRQIYEDPTIGGEAVGLYFDRHLARVGGGNLWVAEEDGPVVGMTGLIMGEDEAEIEPVVVTAARRGRGIGHTLLARALEEARSRGVRHLNIAPVARNGGAIRLFARFGFTIVGHVQLFMDFAPHGRRATRTREEIDELAARLEPWS